MSTSTGTGRGAHTGTGAKPRVTAVRAGGQPPGHGFNTPAPGAWALRRVTAVRAGGRPRGLAYTALAAAAWSLAGILQRQLHMSLASQLAGRAFFAFFALLAFVAVAEGGHVIWAFRA